MLSHSTAIHGCFSEESKKKASLAQKTCVVWSLHWLAGSDLSSAPASAGPGLLLVDLRAPGAQDGLGVWDARLALEPPGGGIWSLYGPRR